MLYDIKFMQHLGELCMHLLGPFEVDYITEEGTIKLNKLQGIPLNGYMNGSQLKLYSYSGTMMQI